MRHVKWIFVVLLICSLTAFVEKDKPTGGLSEGDVAPDFKIESTSEEQPAFKLANMKGRYVLLSFWASYDAQSRIVLTKTELHETCKMDFCCITDLFLDRFR